MACGNARLYRCKSISLYLYCRSSCIFNDCKNISLAPYNFTYSQLVQQSQEYVYDDKCWQKYENRGIYNLITLLDPAKFKRIVYGKIIGNIQEILFPYPMPQEYANSSVENAITEGDLIIEFIISYIEAPGGLYNTKYGEKICISGSSQEFGNWNPYFALELEWNPKCWRKYILLPRKKIEYKYICICGDNVKWEGGANRNLGFTRLKKIHYWRQQDKIVSYLISPSYLPSSYSYSFSNMLPFNNYYIYALT